MNRLSFFGVKELRAISVATFLLSLAASNVKADDEKLHAVKDNQPVQYTGPTSTSMSPALVRSSNPGSPDAGEVTVLTASATTTFPVVVSVAGKRHALRPNPAGIYPRISIPAGASVAIHLATSAQTSVKAMALDGGTIGSSGKMSSQTADANGGADFVYSAPSGLGNHRVTIFVGTQKQTLNFWIGPAPQMKVVTQGN